MPRPPREKVKSEFEQKTLEIRRVTRVVEGGKRFSFRASVVVGDMKGRVATGVGKGGDVALALEKAAFRAKKDFLRVPITNEGSIPHEVAAKYGSACVLLKPAAEGRGIVAGGAVRTICALAGIRHVTGKIIRSKNKINIARATIIALRKLKPAMLAKGSQTAIRREEPVVTQAD
jgi:small subunit ribosomal protein S5